MVWATLLFTDHNRRTIVDLQAVLVNDGITIRDKTTSPPPKAQNAIAATPTFLSRSNHTNTFFLIHVETNEENLTEPRKIYVKHEMLC